VLRELGSRRVWLLHGSDGLDEATTTGATHVVSLEDGAIRAFDIAPEDAGLPRATAQELVGGDPAHNAKALRAVLAGEKNAYRDIAVFNAAIALVVAERAADIMEGAHLAAAALDNGAAAAKLEALVRYSNAED
jgi:anthranilate phosphoribosyltransferase